MKLYKSLGITVIDSGTVRALWITVYIGETLATACEVRKEVDIDDIPEDADWLAWASMCFLQAADQLSEEGWEIRHSAQCPESCMAVADA